MLVGGILFLLNGKCKKSYREGTVIIRWNSEYSASLGIFLFISEDLSREEYQRLFVHEFGHCVQSFIFGPLYLPFMAIPSMLWCMLPLFKKYRSKHNISYYDFYTERLADKLGERYLSYLYKKRK